MDPGFIADGTYLPAIPEPPPSCLPPDGNEELHLTVSNQLSHNDRTSVFGVNVTNADLLGFYVPPLVIKVAAERKGRTLAQEAGMYRDLESLQGVVIARCYGYFRTVVNHLQMAIRPWDDFDAIDWPRIPDKFDIFQMPNSCASLNVLLLERLGEIINPASDDSARKIA